MKKRTWVFLILAIVSILAFVFILTSYKTREKEYVYGGFLFKYDAKEFRIGNESPYNQGNGEILFESKNEDFYVSFIIKNYSSNLPNNPLPTLEELGGQIKEERALIVTDMQLSCVHKDDTESIISCRPIKKDGQHYYMWEGQIFGGQYSSFLIDSKNNTVITKRGYSKAVKLINEVISAQKQ